MTAAAASPHHGGLGDPLSPEAVILATARETAWSALGDGRDAVGTDVRIDVTRVRIAETVRSMLRRVPKAGGASGRLAVEAFGGTAEPSLGEVLADPVVHALMCRDGVPAAALRGVIRDARARLQPG